MAGKRTEEVVDTFIARFRRTVACITDRPVLASGYRMSSRPHDLFIAPRGEFVRLRAVNSRRALLLDVFVEYLIIETGDIRAPYSVRTAGYEYRLLNQDDHEILAFHWHPTGLSNVTDPHLHLSSRLNPIEMGRNQDPLPLAEAHIPTGFITLEDVVRLLISEFGIRPRRMDWDAVLRENRLAAHRELSG